MVGLVLSLKSFCTISSGRIMGHTETNRKTKDDFPTAASPIDVNDFRGGVGEIRREAGFRAKGHSTRKETRSA